MKFSSKAKSFTLFLDLLMVSSTSTNFISDDPGNWCLKWNQVSSRFWENKYVGFDGIPGQKPDIT